MRILLAAVIALVMAAPANAALPTTPLNFGDQPVGTVSPTQSVRIVYPYGLEVRVLGEHPEDFFVTRTDCGADGSYGGQRCEELRVRFAPGVVGARSAKLWLRDWGAWWAPSETVAIPLSGNGVALAGGPQGPAGPQGTPGAPGAKGPQGPRGREAKVTCKVKKVKGSKRIRVTCTTKRAKAARVRLVQGGRVLSSTVRRSRGGRVTASFTVRRGRYVVTVGNTAVRVRG